VPRSAFELADIFRDYGDRYRQAHRLSREQLRVMRAIEVCRTATLGGHVEKCGQCNHLRIAYNSCRNRHCPKCQNTERQKWLADRHSELLPVEYFHVVFTLPEPIARLALQNRKTICGILFQTASETLLTIARDPKHLGAEIGFFAILHTWGQNLLHHPHIHCVVPGGGLSPDRERWISCRPGFFLPVRVLSRLFRRLFLEALDKAAMKNKLRFFGELEHLKGRAAFRRYLEQAHNTEWVVYAKPPFGGPQQVVAYLGRYTHRTAISNQRILNVENGRVTFQWKDYRHKEKQKSRVMTVDAGEFIRRILMHVQPPGFKRIRYCGWMASRHKNENLALCRKLLTPARNLLPEPAADVPCQTRPSPCPQCKTGVMIRLGFIPPCLWPARPPDSS
jgi:hypothetical protein